jgi:O-antigen/teichoic acid export membrane protein
MNADQVGLYVAALAPVGAPFLMSQGVVGVTLAPRYYAAVSSHDRRLETKIFRFWLAATAAICALGVVLVALLKDWIAFLLLAQRYRGGASLMPWIAGGYACYAVAQVFLERLFAYKRNDLTVLVYAVGAVASIVFATVLTRSFGLQGAALACTCSFFALLVAAAVVSELAIPRRRSP